MEQVIFNIDGIDYTDIGNYMDNNAGISFYIPSSENYEDWISFLCNEPIILLWSLGYLQSDVHNVLEVYGETAKTIIECGGERLVLFLKKYCWNDTLDDMFIDFIFGEYSEYGGNYELPKIIHNGNIIDEDCFDYRSHVFIESRRYAEFMKELDTLTDIMNQRLLNDNNI